MEEERQIEKIEIVESQSISECASLPVSRPIRESGADVVGDLSAPEARKFSSGELAVRRSVGQVIDFSIAYGGLLVYFTHSGFVVLHTSGDFIRPVALNLSALGEWGWILLLLSPLPYLYLRWYFKVFKNYFTPGELIAGLGCCPTILGEEPVIGEFQFALGQFTRVVAAFFFAILAFSLAGVPVGLFLICMSWAFRRRKKMAIRCGASLVVCNILWFVSLTVIEKLNEGVFTLVAYALVIGLAFLLLANDNLSVKDDGVKSSSQ